MACQAHKPTTFRHHHQHPQYCVVVCVQAHSDVVWISTIKRVIVAMDGVEGEREREKERDGGQQLVQSCLPISRVMRELYERATWHIDGPIHSSHTHTYVHTRIDTLSLQLAYQSGDWLKMSNIGQREQV